MVTQQQNAISSNHKMQQTETFTVSGKRVDRRQYSPHNKSKHIFVIFVASHPETSLC